MDNLWDDFIGWITGRNLTCDETLNRLVDNANRLSGDMERIEYAERERARDVLERVNNRLSMLPAISRVDVGSPMPIQISVADEAEDIAVPPPLKAEDIAVPSPLKATEPPPAITEDKQAMGFINSIIYCRDRLFTQMDFAREENSELAQKLIRGMLDSTYHMLADNGVSVLNGDGELDTQFQEVAATQPTDDAAQNLRIISTVREGYRYKDSLIRCQQVNVYKYKPAAANQA